MQETCRGNDAHPETGWWAAEQFYSWSSRFNKGFFFFCFLPLRRAPQTPLVIYELSPGLGRFRFMTLRGKVFIGPLSVSLQTASITIARMAPRWTEPEWLHDYSSPLLLSFSPCGCWWYSELCITCSQHSLACLVNPEESCHLCFYDVHKPCAS